MVTEVGKNRETSPKEEVLVTALINGLSATYSLHEKLGDAGRANFQSNRFGETALVMDMQAEEAVLNSLRKTHISFQIFSEEHGEFVIGENPQYTVVVDGLDGSDAYKKGRGKAMYGTMASILKGADPTYDDYLVSGMMIHSPVPQLFLAVRGKGCFLIDIATGERKDIQRSGSVEFSRQIVMDLDINWPPYRELLNTRGKEFPNMQCAEFSAAARCALFVLGDIDIALEFTRKGNIEQPVIYGLVKEMGGVMADTDGEDIGNKHFKAFEQTRKVPLVIAPNQLIAKQVSERLNLKSIRIINYE